MAVYIVTGETKMRIFTGYFSKYKNYIEEGLFPISIAGKCPDWYDGKQFKKLAPKYWFFKKYKDGEFSEQDYKTHFNQEVLSALNPLDVYREFKTFIYEYDGLYEDVILLCYEKPENFCHRHLVADWFNNSYPVFNVRELRIF